MEFRILGPLEADDAGVPLALGPEKQRALLAMLLLEANRAVPVAHLVDGLWGHKPPANATKAVQTYVARLRKTLTSATLRTRPPGYVLVVEPQQLDLVRFELALTDGRTALGEGRAEDAATTLRAALELWRGPALTEFAAEPFAALDAPRLEELRLLGLEARVDADLTLRRHADLVGELEALVERHPLRECFTRQLMLALYRSGRQAEALAVYRDARRYLVDELGIEPSRQLHDLESAILRHDEALDASVVGDRSTVRSEASSVPVLGSFVGREPEIDRLTAVLDGALNGHGRLLMLSGEQGIGKTRTATEVAERAERKGARVAWGRCYEREGAPPYWPWVQIVRGVAGWSDLGEVCAEIPRQAAIVAELVPELADRLPGPPPPLPANDPKEARFRLFDATATFLRHAARQTGLVLVLDDLHAADSGSLLLLEVVARELADARLLVIGTYRDIGLARGHPLAATLGELTRERLFERLAMRGLSEAEVDQFIQASSGDSLPPSVARVVHEKGEGNPLFVTEVVRLLLQQQAPQDGALGKPGGDIGVPESVREAIGRRLDALSAECNEILRAAAVLGREFDIGDLQPLIPGLSDDRVQRELDDASAAHVIERLPSSGRRFRFTHGLIQETLTEELSTTQRVRMHADIVQALESLHGEVAEARAAELVRHAVEAVTVLGPERVVRYAQIAGEEALAAYSYDAAIDYFVQALEAKGGVSDDEAARLYFELARSEFAARERYSLDGALEHMRIAFTHFLAAGDERSAIEIAAYPIPYVYGSPEGADLAARALDLVPADSREAGRLLATLGWFAGLHDYVRAADAFGRAQEIAATLGDRELERRLLVREAHVDFWHLEFQDCLDKATTSIALAREAGDEQTELAALNEASRMCTALGDRDSATAHLARMLVLAERFREQYWLVTARVNAQWLAVLVGDWEQAQRLSDEALALQRRDARTLGLRAVVEATLGNRSEASESVEQLLQARSLSAPGFPFEDACVAAFVPIVAALTGEDDRRLDAEEAGQAVDACEHAVPFLALYVSVGRGLDAVRRREAALAGDLHDTLLHLRGTYPALLGVSADRLLGSLAVAAGELRAGVEHFERGIDGCRRAGYRPEHAWTASCASAALLDLGGARERSRAAELRAEATALARELHMAPLQASSTS
jgi:DNA-binding SARP family transcriptional activator